MLVIPDTSLLVVPCKNVERIYECAPDKGTPVMLCNGGPGCCDYLGPVADMIDDLATVIRFEQRGCGRSDKKGPYDVQTCIADLERIREFYGIDRWIICGHSWGVDLAIAYSVYHSERMLGLIGISGGVIHRDQAWSEEYHRKKDSEGESQPDFEFPPNMDVNHEVNISWRQFVRQPNLLRRIAEMDFPALFIYGDKDIRPSWPVKQLANLMPNARFIEIKEAAHVIWLTHGLEMKGYLREFIQDKKGYL